MTYNIRYRDLLKHKMFKNIIAKQIFKSGYRIANKTQGRRIVIPDIHGCAFTFKSLVLNKLKITKKDQIFLLGDYIDRGINNLETIDFILDLIDQKFQIYPLRGNHEENLIEAWKDYKFIKHSKDIHFKDWIRSTDLLHNNVLRPRIINFVNVLPYYFELDNFILVHAGLNLNKPFEDYEAMIRTREMKSNSSIEKTIIRGHVVTELSQIKLQIEKRSQILSIDNGCVFKNSNQKKDIGNLIALNIDNFELIIQENIEPQNI